MTVTYDKVQAEAITKAWKDPAFKKKLLENPKQVLNEMGLNIPESVNMIAQEKKGGDFHLFVPPAPTDLEALTEGELQQMALNCTTGPSCYGPARGANGELLGTCS